MYLRLDHQVGELWSRTGGLPNPQEAADIWKGIWYEEAHHSTAIEGNTLVLKQVEALLREGRAIGNKELREYMEVQGYAQASEWVYGQGIYQHGDWNVENTITLTELRQIHRHALDLVWEVAPHPEATPAESPGSFREHDIQPFPGGMTPPTWPLVPALLDAWVTCGTISNRATRTSRTDSLRSIARSSRSIHSSTGTDAPAGWSST